MEEKERVREARNGRESRRKQRWVLWKRKGLRKEVDG